MLGCSIRAHSASSFWESFCPVLNMLRTGKLATPSPSGLNLMSASRSISRAALLMR